MGYLDGFAVTHPPAPSVRRQAGHHRVLGWALRQEARHAERARRRRRREDPQAGAPARTPRPQPVRGRHGEVHRLRAVRGRVPGEVHLRARRTTTTPRIPTSPGERFGFVYEINYLRCIHCDLCVEACPTEAITETKLFEFSFTNRQDAIYTKKELLVDDEGNPKHMPWEDWRDGEDEHTSGWMRATSPSGDATFRGVVGWSNELGHGERAPEPPQAEADQ